MLINVFYSLSGGYKKIKYVHCSCSSVAEEDLDSFLRNTKFQYEAFRSSSKSSFFFFTSVFK